MRVVSKLATLLKHCSPKTSHHALVSSSVSRCVQLSHSGLQWSVHDRGIHISSHSQSQSRSQSRYKSGKSRSGSEHESDNGNGRFGGLYSLSAKICVGLILGGVGYTTLVRYSLCEDEEIEQSKLTKPTENKTRRPKLQEAIDTARDICQRIKVLLQKY
jgi:hypothetical protein